MSELTRRTVVDHDELLTELKSDFSLFAHMLRKLAAHVRSDASPINPVRLLHTLNGPQLEEIFSLHASDLSVHDLSSVKEVQLMRARHSAISCSTASLLAERASIDPNIAYTCALTRQLGHLLVAWNYQSSVLRAEQATSDGGDFESELIKYVGFNPAVLGYETVLTWCKSPAVLQGIGYKAMSQEVEGQGDEGGEEGRLFLKFSKLGEVLARINDPARYPNATKEWAAAGKEMERYLGPKGTDLIRQRLQELFPHYVNFAPQLFLKDLSPEKVVRSINAQYQKKLLNENVYIGRCPEELKKLFATVYENIAQAEASIAAVNQLVARVMPTAGFYTGCIYFLDPNKMVLMPRLKIGENNTKNYRPVSCSCGGARAHPVAEAFHCATPFREENVVLNGDVTSHITGKFGTADRMGVLHLEFTEGAAQTIESEQRLLYFKAIRQALSDALSMR